MRDGYRYCLLYTVSCVTKHSADVRLLVFGRVCSGVATSLLYSVFEAWMVAEHNSRKHALQLLDSTFSHAALISAVVAVAAGQVAAAAHKLLDTPLCVSSLSHNNISSVAAACDGSRHTVPWSECDAGVPLAPFNLVVICCALAAAIIAFTWTENTGSSSSSTTSTTSRQGGQLMTALKRISSTPALWKLGLVQSLFEGSMCDAALLIYAKNVTLCSCTCSWRCGTTTLPPPRSLRAST
jgi:hypothetical protein